MDADETQKSAPPIRPIECPAIEPLDSDTVSSALAPLLDALQNNLSVEVETAFTRGTLCPDGRLDLCKQDIGPAGAKLVMDALRQNKQVKHLLLGTNAIGTPGAGALAALVSQVTPLQTLYLGCNYIEGDGIETLAEAVSSNPSITALWLKRNPIGPVGFEAIARLLEKDKNLTVLDLVNTGIDLPSLQRLVDVLPDSGIEHLYLGGNGLTVAHAHVLCELLSKSKKLLGLYLAVNNLADDGAEVLAEGLKQNDDLRVLSLSSNGITSTGFKPLSKAITFHSNLRILELGPAPSTEVLNATLNRIGDEGANLMANVLAQNGMLMSVDLRNNGITLVGAQALSDGVSHNGGIRQLRLDRNRIPSAIVLEIQRYCLENGAGGELSPTLLREHLSAIQSVYR